MGKTKPFAFVLMPFAGEFQNVYEEGIKKACRDAGARCERVDEQMFTESILDRIYGQIKKADIVIAEMTGRNPNVFYEVGYAHAIGKQVILLTQNANDIPFDLQHYPHVVYDDGTLAEMKANLKARVRWCIENRRQQLLELEMPLTQVKVCQFDRALMYLPVYMADRLGFFAEEGLGVSFVNSHGDAATWEALVKGEADFGVSDPIVMLNNSTVKGVVVAALVVKSVLWGISKAGLPRIQSGEDLRGKTLATFDEQSTAHQILVHFLSRYGLVKDKDYTIKEVKPHQEYQYLNDGAVIFTHEPLASSMKIDKYTEIFAALDFEGYDDFLNTGLFARADYVERNRAIVQGMVNAITKAMKVFREEPWKGLEVALQEFPDYGEKGVLASFVRLFNDGIVPEHAVALERAWSNSLNVRFGASGRILSFSEYVDNRFAQEAKRKMKL